MEAKIIRLSVKPKPRDLIPMVLEGLIFVNMNKEKHDGEDGEVGPTLTEPLTTSTKIDA